MNVLKKMVSLLPGGAKLARRISNFRRGRKLARIGDTEDRFNYIFRHKKWKDPESVSGEGSSLRATESIRREIPRLLHAYSVRRLLDAPCGDFNWFRHVERGDVTYIGGDIVKALVDINESRFSDSRTSFRHLDIASDPLPAVDLWLCRDCLIHLSFELIDAVLRNFENSSIEYLLVSNYPGVSENYDIPTGHARMLNLCLAPFNFPAPLAAIDDSNDGSGSKQLALWSRSQLLGKQR